MEGITLWTILIGGFIAILCGVTFIFTSLANKKKKLHVAYRDPMGGNLIANIMFTIMPRSMILKGMAPKGRPLDVFDVLQEDPYQIKEVEVGKVWSVSYKQGGGDPSEGKAFGMDDKDSTYKKILAYATLEGDDKVAQMKKDWVLWKEYFKIDPKLGKKGEYCRKVTSDLIMVVVKLKSGDLLLYCPVTVHDGTSLDKFLKNLGTVKYIVIGSCFHTNHLPASTKRYPDAKVIGTTPAEIKLNAVDALPRKKLDFDLLNETQFKNIYSILEKEGVAMYFSKHEVMTNSVFLVAYNTGCEVDLIYGHHDSCDCGYKYSFCPANKNRDPQNFMGRIFRYLMLSKPDSPNGKLALYRFAAMDPCSLMSCLCCPSPAPDGSSCTELANFLRHLAKLDFKQVISVHSHLQTAENFKKSLDAGWNWLDNNSLLPLESDE